MHEAALNVSWPAVLASDLPQPAVHEKDQADVHLDVAIMFPCLPRRTALCRDGI